MKNNDIGILPVVNNWKEKKLAGIITDRDLVLRVVAEESDPLVTALGRIISKPAVTCSPDDTYDSALSLMKKKKVKRVAVTENSGRIVGVITESDVALRAGDPEKTWRR